MLRNAKAKTEAKAKTRGLQGERATRIQTAGIHSRKEPLRCICLLKHDGSAAARTARQAPWQAYLSTLNLPRWKNGTDFMPSPSCRSLVEPRISVRFTWVVGRLRRAKTRSAETKYATDAAHHQKEIHDRFSEDPPPPHPTRLFVILDLLLRVFVPIIVLPCTKFCPELHHARLFFAISHFCVYICSG